MGSAVRAIPTYGMLAAPTFTRYNEKASDEHSKGTFQLNGQCLTEVYPGDKIDGNPHTPDVSTGMRRDYGQMRIVTRLFEPRNQIAGVECSVNLGTGGSGGGVIYGGGSSTTLEPSSTKAT